MLRVFFRCPIFKNPRFVGFVWFATALVACLLKLPVGRTYNNFMIYRASFFHALELKDLYIYIIRMNTTTGFYTGSLLRL